MGTSSFPNGFSGGVVLQNVPVTIPHPGKVFWVNNTTVLADQGAGGSNGNDGSYRRPFSTLDYAVGRCSAGRGDVIYVMPGYTQTMSAADAVDIDVAGVKVIGLGVGNTRPKFTYDNSAGEFVIGAANVSIENLWFVPSVTGITHAVDVEATFTGAKIISCEFSGAETPGTDEFNAAITVGTTANDGVIQGCFFDAGLAGAVYAISLATPGNWQILDNVIIGDYSTACIGTITGAGVNCHMYRNTVVNGHAGALNTVAVFTQSAAGSWYVGNNMFATDVATGILFFTNYTSTINLGNVYTDDTTMAGTAGATSATIVAFVDA